MLCQSNETNRRYILANDDILLFYLEGIEMKKSLSLLIVLLIMSSPLLAQEITDHRQMVEMPPAMKQMFLKNMRGHMESLDLIIASLAAKDLSVAADIAEGKMGVGHGKKRQCDDSSHQHKTDHSEHKGKGFGQFMPTDMKVMGMSLHNAANEFATVARRGDIGEAYNALRQISASCVACHQSFRVK